MADPARRLIQLQSFATIEYDERTVKFILLNREGQPIDALSPPLEFTFEQIYDEQVFTTNIGNKQVQFVNVLLDPDDHQYASLKGLTHSVGNLETVGFMALMSRSKDPLRPPRKDLEANTMRELLIEDGVLATVTRVVDRDHSLPA